MRRSDYIADGPSQFLLHGAPAINDCMYRNMYRFRHIIVVDLDEVQLLLQYSMFSQWPSNHYAYSNYVCSYPFTPLWRFEPGTQLN